jgi:hypothetical protein
VKSLHEHTQNHNNTLDNINNTIEAMRDDINQIQSDVRYKIDGKKQIYRSGT